ncbi:SubName: Full=Uncharacterized protein {ECO:0000313/EMBL:CCA75996.1} [Serendipita indica DSM 11827]|nr:SubName: Full=Uncharacterized protein {ECO:0000313/EMBL:CCA75996.1} [Serendipita indica DSM 11827]
MQLTSDVRDIPTQPGFSFRVGARSPEDPAGPTESAKLRLDGSGGGTRGSPSGSRRTLQPRYLPQIPLAGVSPASGRLKTSPIHDQTQYWVVTQAILGSSAARKYNLCVIGCHQLTVVLGKRAPLILLAAREDNWDEPALPIGDDGYACPYASLRRLSDRLNAASGRKRLQTECYDRPFFPPTDRARTNYVAGTIRCDYGGSICAQGRSAVVSMKEPCRTKVNSWESYSRHVICSHIVDGRPSTGETIDDRIIHRLRRSLVAIGNVEAATSSTLTTQKELEKREKG